MHDYAVCAGAVGVQAVQVTPGLLGANAPVMMTSHAVIGGSSMAASASASESASMPLSDSRSTTSTTSTTSRVTGTTSRVTGTTSRARREAPGSLLRS